jgi:hypothetical protein
MAKKEQSKKEPIIFQQEKFGRIKLNYFTDSLGITGAVFNTRRHLEFAARDFVLKRGTATKSEKAATITFDDIKKIDSLITSGIMAIFDTPPRLQTRAERLFLFRLIQLTDKFFASGDADREAETEAAAARTTADGQDAKKLKTLFYIDAVNSKIVDVATRDLTFHRQGGATRKDELDFDPLSGSKLVKEMFGSLSAAQIAFAAHLDDRIESAERKVKDQQAELERLLQKRANLKVEMSVYLPKSSTKKPEKIGNVRI